MKPEQIYICLDIKININNKRLSYCPITMFFLLNKNNEVELGF